MTTQCAWCVKAGRVERIEGASDGMCAEHLEELYPEPEGEERGR